MADYIDRQSVLDILYNFSEYASYTPSAGFMKLKTAEINLGELHAIPAADVRENVKGAWKQMPKGWFRSRDVQCSNCGNTLDMNGVNAGRGDANFCPNCGADMRGEHDDHQGMAEKSEGMDAYKRLIDPKIDRRH